MVLKLSIIIPVYNEEKTIEKVLQQVCDFSLVGGQKEIVIVNDGSTDQSAKIIESFIKHKKDVLFFQQQNMGKGAAIKTGIKHAHGEYIVIQDADLEYNPEDINKLFQIVRNGKAQVVYGTRLKRLPNFTKEERTFQFLLHYVGNKFLSLLTSILYGQWITDMETCYKLFPKKAVESFHLQAKGFEFEPEITAKLLKKGFTIFEIPITTRPRGYSEGKKLDTFHDGKKALMTLLNYRFSNE